MSKSSGILVSDKFKGEEVASNSGDLSKYKPKDITEQTDRLRQLFPGIGYADENLTSGTLPPNAEGWFAIPKWENVASTYNQAVRDVLDIIMKTRGDKFLNYIRSNLGPERLRQTPRSAQAFEVLGQTQKGYEILIVPAQFGLRHRGLSVRSAYELFTGNEFGLGVFAASIMLLTHPERFTDNGTLGVYCSGDQYDDPFSNLLFSEVPCFLLNDDLLMFNLRSLDCGRDHFGSLSGFLPM